MSRHPPEAFAAVEQYMTEHGYDLEDLDDRPWQHGQVHRGYSTAAMDALLQPPENPHDGTLPSSRASPQDSYNMRSLGLTDLNILSAATHADGQVIEQRVAAPGNNNRTSFAFQLNDNASEEPGFDPSEYGGFQKMSGRSSGDSDEDQSTKQRGRPRLDKRDATAADVSPGFHYYLTQISNDAAVPSFLLSCLLRDIMNYSALHPVAFITVYSDFYHSSCPSSIVVFIRHH